jgi:hypothetical protein
MSILRRWIRIGLSASTNLRLKRYIGVRTSCADPYINTLMIQKVLAQPHWQGRLTPRDYAALTPLIWEHVNPYGRFDLDMNARLALLL